MPEIHGEKAAASSLHSNVTPPSLEEKVKAAVVELTVPVGPAVIVVSGRVVSIMIFRLAPRDPGAPGVGSPRFAGVPPKLLIVPPLRTNEEVAR